MIAGRRITRLQEQSMIRGALLTARRYVGPEAIEQLDEDLVFDLVDSACRNFARDCLPENVAVTTGEFQAAAQLAIEMADAGM